MSLERLDDAFKRYASHLESVKRRSIEDARARLLSEHKRFIEEVNRLFNTAITNFENKLKSS